MASFTYNAGSKLIADRSIDWASDTIKVMLIGAATPYTPNKDHDGVDDIAASELAVTGYAGGFAGAGRKTLGTKTITNDTTNDRTVFDAADPSAWTLSAGDDVVAAVIYKHITDDATSVPIFYLELTAPVPTNGSTFTLQFAATGIGYTQQ